MLEKKYERTGLGTGASGKVSSFESIEVHTRPEVSRCEWNLTTQVHLSGLGTCKLNHPYRISNADRKGFFWRPDRVSGVLHLDTQEVGCWPRPAWMLSRFYNPAPACLGCVAAFPIIPTRGT